MLLPTDTAQTAAAVKLLSDAKIHFVARGAGTGLSGGALALDGAAIIALARMDRVLRLEDGVLVKVDVASGS